MLLRNKIVKNYIFLIIIILLIPFSSCDEVSRGKSTDESIDEIYNQKKLILEDGWKIYLDKNKKFIIGYPSNWKVEEMEGVEFYAVRIDNEEKVFLENFHLGVQELDEKITMEDFSIDFFADQMRQAPSYSFINKESGYIIDNKEKTFWTSYELVEQGGMKLFTLSVFIRIDSKVYILNFYSLLERKKEYNKVFDKIIRSLIIK